MGSGKLRGVSLSHFFTLFRGGLRGRFFRSMILIIVIVMGGVFIVVEKTNRDVILMEGKKRALSNALYLASLSRAPLLMYDYTKLEQNVDEVAKEADIVYAMILDRNGSVLAHSKRDDLIGRILDDELSMNAASSKEQLIQDFRNPQTGEDIWDITCPIFQGQEDKWGMVRIGFSKEKLKAEIARNRSNLVILSLVAVLLAGVAATILAEKIAGPIRTLSARALSISKGDLHQEISLRTGDEIEELADTFNKMTGELKLKRDEEKTLIQKLSENNERLKEEIDARKQLEEELINAERLRALGEMSGGVAHDFNNILGAILGRAQLLLEKVDSQEVRGGIEIIEKAALDGAETVRRIQEFTRVRVDNSTFSSLDINQIISDSIEFTRTRWKNETEVWGRPIEMQCDLGNIPRMMGDPSGLREVFTNLIINAVDAMPKGGVIRFSTEVHGDSVVVKVQDSGIGMSGEVQKRTFDPFFTTKGTRGSGLGLSICYGIVSRHKGEIRVNSRVGKGTTFTIHLPLGLPGETPAGLPEIEQSIIQARILVVDDDEMMRAVLTDILIQSGCHVDEVASGQEGIDLFSQDEYDVVLTDLGLEDMSGWDVAMKVKNRSPLTPVALITGWGMQLSEKETHSRGVDFVVSKPFRLEELRSVINRALTLRGERRIPPA
jgi:signal transduction histidine kinase/ActR/RegA family two-component response regulator